MTTRCKWMKGAVAPLIAAMLVATSAAAASLPAPGAYVLQRIQPTPQAMLLGADGGKTPLAEYTRGAVTALGFFYGHCTDAAGCPVAWSTFEAARMDAARDPLLQDKLRLVFISLDPARDTPSVLRLFASAEKDARVPWLFLTAESEPALAPLLAAMGQDVAHEIDRSGRRTGMINHMLKVFLIDPDGWVREIYSTAFLTPEALLNDARTLAMAFPNAKNAVTR